VKYGIPYYFLSPKNSKKSKKFQFLTIPNLPCTCMSLVLNISSTSIYLYRNLPAKDPKEEKRHRQLYQQMIEVAKKKGKVFWPILAVPS
jgi:hypothetical protein